MSTTGRRKTSVLFFSCFLSVLMYLFFSNFKSLKPCNIETAYLKI